jgi:hypothetical protein
MGAAASTAGTCAGTCADNAGAGAGDAAIAGAAIQTSSSTTAGACTSAGAVSETGAATTVASDSWMGSGTALRSDDSGGGAGVCAGNAGTTAAAGGITRTSAGAGADNATTAAASSSAATPANDDHDPFPKLGLTLEAFQNFIDMHGGRPNFEGKTTTDVCMEILKTSVFDNNKLWTLSYCDLLENQQSLHVGTADCFVSHAWRYLFLDVFDALTSHFADNSKAHFLWFDLFSNNQHNTMDHAFSWWQDVFSKAIADFKYTVMVLSPWADPVPFTRAWCLWEIYCTVATESRFDVAMTPFERGSFLKQILDVGRTVHAYEKMLGDIDLRKSNAWREVRS